MSLLNALHEQYEADGDVVLFRCRECGYTSLSLGGCHGHIERHRGYTPLNIQLPFTDTSPGDFDRLMESTEVVAVEKTRRVELSEVEGL